ncbi:hypothetical protein DFH28DRAFT_92018 [Melampsora americana]|nr:hypothetical protein DFH28DRAFT_92018 [Melampsora americana]
MEDEKSRKKQRRDRKEQGDGLCDEAQILYKRTSNWKDYQIALPVGVKRKILFALRFFPAFSSLGFHLSRTLGHPKLLSLTWIKARFKYGRTCQLLWRLYRLSYLFFFFIVPLLHRVQTSPNLYTSLHFHRIYSSITPASSQIPSFAICRVPFNLKASGFLTSFRFLTFIA